MSSENIVTRVQNINPRGFRSFQNYRIRILFHCGKLNSPDESNKAPRGKPLGITPLFKLLAFSQLSPQGTGN